MSAPSPLLAALGILGHAVGEAHEAEDQGHGNADQQETEQAAHGLVPEVLDNQLGGHFLGPLAGGAVVSWGGPAAAGRPPARWYRRAGRGRTGRPSTPLLMSIFRISRTMAYSSCGRLISMCLGKGTLS